MDYELQFGPLVPYIPAFLRGVVVTLQISTLAMGLCSLIGLVLAGMRMSNVPPMRWFAVAFVDLVRGIPALVLLIYIYYGFAMFLGVSIPPITAGVVGLSFYYGAYMSETFRAGIQAVNRGEIEAAWSLGMSKPLVARRVILPQAFRIILPPFANNFISMLKDSSLVSVLAVSELMREGQNVMISTFRAFEVFTVVALIYYLMTTILSAGTSLLERKLRIKR